jgi:DnaJ family protein C protein 19
VDRPPRTGEGANIAAAWLAREKFEGKPKQNEQIQCVTRQVRCPKSRYAARIKNSQLNRGEGRRESYQVISSFDCQCIVLRHRSTVTMSTFVVAGAALTAIGLAGRAILRQSTKVSYYRGGFEPAMTKREASLILGLNTTSPSEDKVKQAHKKIIVLNHPDKGGSPYLAAKINEAKAKLLH